MPRGLIAVVLVWLLGPLPVAWAQPRLDLTGEHRIELGPPIRVTGVLESRIHAPKLVAREWVVFMPTLAEHDGQRPLASSFNQVGSPHRAALVNEASTAARRVHRLRIPAETPAERTTVHMETRYTAEMRPRRLVPGAPRTPVAPLSDDERRLWTRASPLVNFKDADFQAWLTTHNLRRAEESDLAFGYRVFRAIAEQYTYKFPAGDRTLSEVCQAKGTDCGGLSVLFVGAMRASGVPARALVGRWAKSSEGDQGRWHVRAEFYAAGVGWVPVEPAGRITWPRATDALCFGADRGKFLTFHLGVDLELDPIHFEPEIVRWLQRPVYWVTGSGSFDDLDARHTWRVAIDGNAVTPNE